MKRLATLLLFAGLGIATTVQANYTVQGTFLYKDHEFNTTGFTGSNDLPIRFADVDVVDADLGAVLASGATNANGEFNISVTDNQTRNLSVRVKSSTVNTAGLYFDVRRTSDRLVYAVAHPTFTSHSPSQNIDFRSTPVVAVQYSGGDVFNIFDTALNGIDFVASLNGGRPGASQNLTLFWCSYTDPTCTGPPPYYYNDGTYYTGKTIHLLGASDDSDGYDDSVILHEFGHYVEFVLAASDNGGGSHAPNGCYDLSLVWSEGYATFLQNMVRDWMGIDRADIYVDTSGQPNPGNAFLSYSVETPPSIFNVMGSGNEVGVNAALWDIVDGTATKDGWPGMDDDVMRIADGPTRFWDVFTNYLPLPTVTSISIEDFWDGWFVKNKGYQTEMRSVFGARKMEFWDDAFEGDDAVSVARKGGITNGTTHHTIYGAGDFDWTQFDGVTGGTYVFEVRNLPCGSSVDLTLFDSNGTTLLAGPSSYIEYTANKSGALYLRARRPADKHQYATYDLYVDISVGVTVSDVQIEATTDGVRLTWHAAPDGAFSHFDVERASTADGPWMRLNADPIEIGTSGGTQVEYTDTTAMAGEEFFYRLVGVDADGAYTAFGPYAITAAAPLRLALLPPRPNPFNPSTQLRFDLPHSAAVRLGVYDLRGRLVRTLLRGEVLPAGSREIQWDGRNDQGLDAASGIYLLRLESDGQRQTQRAVLLR